MAIAFAGLLGWIAAEQLSQRAGHFVLVASGAFAPFAVLWWAITQDLSAWVFMQAGGLVAIAAMATATGPMRKVAWQVIAWYALAKVFETFDHQIYESTAEFVSGHSLKHVAAALAAVAPIVWVRGSGTDLENQRQRAAAQCPSDIFSPYLCAIAPAKSSL